MSSLRTYLVLGCLAIVALSMPAVEHAGIRSVSELVVRRDMAGLPKDKDNIVCPDVRPGKNQSKDFVRFNDTALEAATQQGLYSKPGSSDANPGGFAIEFEKDAELKFPHCKPDVDLYQYPILASGVVYGGGDPGPFRVIFTADDWAKRDGTFCGIVYQEQSGYGSGKGLFKHCQDAVGEA